MIFACLFVMRVDWLARVRRSHQRGSTGIARPSKFIRTIYVLVGSVVANFTTLFGKGFSGLLVFTLSGQDQFNDPFVAIIIVVFVVSLPLQVYLINASLVVNNILYHMPNFYVFWNVGNIVTGAVFYNEKAHFQRATGCFSSAASRCCFSASCAPISPPPENRRPAPSPGKWWSFCYTATCCAASRDTTRRPARRTRPAPTPRRKKTAKHPSRRRRCAAYCVYTDIADAKTILYRNRPSICCFCVHAARHDRAANTTP